MARTRASHGSYLCRYGDHAHRTVEWEHTADEVPIVSPSAWANHGHAQDNRDLATASAADVRRQLSTAVGRVYLTVLLQHQQLDVATRACDTARSHYDYAHTRLGLGLGNGVDDARAEQELRTDEAQLKDAETALVRAQSALATLLSEEDLVDVADAFDLATAPAPDTALDTALYFNGGRTRALEHAGLRRSPVRRMGSTTLRRCWRKPRPSRRPKRHFNLEVAGR